MNERALVANCGVAQQQVNILKSGPLYTSSWNRTDHGIQPQ